MTETTAGELLEFCVFICLATAMLNLVYYYDLALSHAGLITRLRIG
jgi:hypothetical protein